MFRSRWAPVGFFLLLVALLASGCAGSYSPTGTSTAGEASGSAVAQAPAAEAPGGAAPEPRAELAADTLDLPETQRRIIYTADLSLLVADMARWERDLERLLKAHRGFLANSEMGGEPGASRSGTWQVRVPVTRFQPFLSEVQKLGEVRRVKTDSEDVSEEYFDLEARLKNKRVEEQRLIAHLQRSTARLQDILSVEKELSRVREEVERMEGRIRYLQNRTELTTVTLTVAERQTFTPPTNPSFSTQVARTFGDSLKLLGDVGQGLVLLCVALTPWALLLAVIGAPIWLLARRRS